MRTVIEAMRIISNNENEFDNEIARVDTYYDRHYKMWVVTCYNKEDYPIGDKIWVWTKKEAQDTKQDILNGKVKPDHI